MPSRKVLTDSQLDKFTDKRDKIVVRKSNEFIQKARYDLSPREWRIIGYAMSKIRKGDTPATEYTLDLSELYDICGLRSSSYTELKLIIKALDDKSWWLQTVRDGKEYESIVRWFNTVDVESNRQKVKIKFHERMMPFIFGLFDRYEQYGEMYSSLMLKYSLPMKRMYSPRLYELLMSYKINNMEWWFEVDKLKHLLNCDKYKTWKDFRLRALDPAVEEINKYTNINVSYEITDKTGKKVEVITFYMEEKSVREQVQAEKRGLSRFNPGRNYWDYLDDTQMTLDEAMDNEDD